jgi:hypothetical protein
VPVPDATADALDELVPGGVTLGGVRLGERMVRWAEAGSGQPTVVLEAGRDDTVISWAPVMAALAGQVRVVAYDRAGLGASDPAPAGNVPRVALGVRVEVVVPQREIRLQRVIGALGPWIARAEFVALECVLLVQIADASGLRGRDYRLVELVDEADEPRQFGGDERGAQEPAHSPAKVNGGWLAGLEDRLPRIANTGLTRR